MGLEQTTSKPATAARLDYDRYRLRSFVERLAEAECE